MNIGIVGAGIMGRLLAWQLAKRGDSVTLFDRDRIVPGQGDGRAAAYTAAGMLTPFSEADAAEEAIVRLGTVSLALWPQIIADLGDDVDFHQTGSLVLAHANDRADLANFRAHTSRIKSADAAQKNLTRAQLGELEPELARHFHEAVFIPGESWLSPPLVLQALAASLRDMRVRFVEAVAVDRIEAGSVHCGCSTWHFDVVIDCRGLGAKPDMPRLRGVRGELIWLRAPGVNLRHLVRLMHPRYRIYIVPRAKNIFVVGATQIESASGEPITVRSALELLSAAYSVHAGFGEACILQTRVNCRPALPDNLPTISYRRGVMRINGLFRHGFLLAPVLAGEAVRMLDGDGDNKGPICDMLEHRANYYQRVTA